jgi:hypothetical protein
MRGTRLLVALLCTTISMCFSQNQRVVPMGYELYSWQAPSGHWNFSVLYNTSSEKTVKEVFNPKTVLHGLTRLKQKLRKLPSGATVFWLDRIPSGTGPKAKGSESLSYPPPELIQEIRNYAEEHKVKIDVQR